MYRRAVAAIAAATTLAGSAGAQAGAEPFDRVDRESRDLIQTFRCAGSAGQLRAAGIPAPSDSLGYLGVCVVMNGRRYGAWVGMDSAMTRATRFHIVDFATRQAYRGTVDTNRVLAMVRAQDAGVEKGYPAYEKADRQFGPIVLRTDGDSISVWLVPIPQSRTPVVGGMRGYLYTPDGRTLVREIDDFATFREFTIPDTGTVVIQSTAESIPTMSEMILANSLNEAGRLVRIETRARSSTLTGRGAAAFWLHVRKP